MKNRHDLVRDQIESRLAAWAEACPDILFAYLHGSLIDPAVTRPRDIDVAVYLAPERFALHRQHSDLQWSAAIPMEMELVRLLHLHVDLQIANRAPLRFRYRLATSGVVLTDKDPTARAEFEYLARVEFFDFLPRLNEYMHEAAS